MRPRWHCCALLSVVIAMPYCLHCTSHAGAACLLTSAPSLLPSAVPCACSLLVSPDGAPPQAAGRLNEAQRQRASTHAQPRSSRPRSSSSAAQPGRLQPLTGQQLHGLAAAPQPAAAAPAVVAVLDLASAAAGGSSSRQTAGKGGPVLQASNKSKQKKKGKQPAAEAPQDAPAAPRDSILDMLLQGL